MKMNNENWAKAVKERDGYICTICSSQENLDAHHVVPKSLGGKLELDNGVTLCEECHQDIHKNNMSPHALHSKSISIIPEVRAIVNKEAYVGLRIFCIKHGFSISNTLRSVVLAAINNDERMDELLKTYDPASAKP